MNDEQLLVLIESLGDDAKTAFLFFIAVKYGMKLIIFITISWGVQTLWKNRDWFKD